MERRPLTTRSAHWAGRLASRINAAGITPNQISIGSVGFALLGALALLATRGTDIRLFQFFLFLIGAGGIQGRLLCNMIDGMVAIEGGKKTSSGDLFNEFPDRISDIILLVAAGYAAQPFSMAVTLGWLAGSGALITAYIRALGASLGTPNYFAGPMAKPHRMAVLTVACVLAAILQFWRVEISMLGLALLIIIVGEIITVWRRLRLIGRELAKRG